MHHEHVGARGRQGRHAAVGVPVGTSQKSGTAARLVRNGVESGQQSERGGWLGFSGWLQQVLDGSIATLSELLRFFYFFKKAQ